MPTRDRDGEGRKEGVYGPEGTTKLATGKENVGEKGGWVDYRDQWCREGKEEKENVFRYRERVAVLRRSLV